MGRKRHFKHTLTPPRLNNARPNEKPYKLTDRGGLFVQVMPGGSKTSCHQYSSEGSVGR
jgi:hypothetical protein